MTKIGIAINLYNKFEELAILVDIIRKNWKNKYIISVCSNFPEAEKRIKEMGIDIDAYSQGDDIFYSPNEMQGIRKTVNLYARVIENMRKACRGAEKLGADYVMHLQTDAWPLKEEGLLKIINRMKAENKKAALRGFGFAKYGHDCPLGHIDDMFFIYETKYFNKVGFFDFSALEILPCRLSIHGILSTVLVGKVGIRNIYLYDDHTKSVFWDGEPKNELVRRCLPASLDPETGFLHVNAASFPGDYAPRIQAMYLQDYGLTKGGHIEAFLRKYGMPKKQLLDELNSIERKMKLKLRLLGFPILRLGRFGRDFGKMQSYLNSSLTGKIKYVLVSVGRSIAESVLFKKLGIVVFPEYSVWPEDLESFYSRILDASDYPDKSMVWFKKRDGKKDKVSIHNRFDTH